MAETAREVARSYAFCYFGSLRCAERLENMLSILPEQKRQNLREILRRAARLTPEEMANRLLVLREKVRPEACQADVCWEHLPPAVQRLLSVYSQEKYGREGH